MISGRYISDFLQICIICTRSVTYRDHYNTCASCDRIFHHDHLKIWLKKSIKCPYCQVPLNSEIVQYHRQLGTVSKLNRSSFNREQLVSLDPMANRAPSKTHRSYFDHPLHYTGNACSCYAEKLSSIGGPENQTSMTWKMRLLSFLFVGLILVIEAGAISMMFIRMGVWYGTWYEYILTMLIIIMLILFFIGISKIIYGIHTRYNCPIHSLFGSKAKMS